MRPEAPVKCRKKAAEEGLAPGTLWGEVLFLRGLAGTGPNQRPGMLSCGQLVAVEPGVRGTILYGGEKGQEVPVSVSLSCG